MLCRASLIAKQIYARVQLVKCLEYAAKMCHTALRLANLLVYFCLGGHQRYDTYDLYASYSINDGGICIMNCDIAGHGHAILIIALFVRTLENSKSMLTHE